MSEPAVTSPIYPLYRELLNFDQLVSISLDIVGRFTCDPTLFSKFPLWCPGTDFEVRRQCFVAEIGNFEGKLAQLQLQFALEGFTLSTGTGKGVKGEQEDYLAHCMSIFQRIKQDVQSYGRWVEYLMGIVRARVE